MLLSLFYFCCTGATFLLCYFPLNTNLGGFTPVIDETGKITGYKTTVGGADTVFPFSSRSMEAFLFRIGTDGEIGDIGISITNNDISINHTGGDFDGNSFYTKYSYPTITLMIKKKCTISYRINGETTFTQKTVDAGFSLSINYRQIYHVLTYDF